MKSHQESQWEYVLQNLGEWRGSFTQIAPDGVTIEDTPSLISLESVDNQSIHLVLQRFYPIDLETTARRTHEMVYDFSAPGSGALFFENGSFSEAAPYFSTYLKFTAEFCLLNSDRASSRDASRRLRFVQLFNTDSQLYQLTLIREQRVGSEAAERPLLRVEDLIGHWQGKAITRFPDGSAPKHHATAVEIQRESETQLVQRCTREQEEPIAPTLLTLTHNRALTFQDNGQSFQTLLLPDGGSSTCPSLIQPGLPFFLEVGWLFQADRRQRLIRRYGSDGKWLSVTWITEQRVKPSPRL